MDFKVVSVRIWWLGVILTAGLGLVFWVVLGMGVKMAVTKEVLNREQTVARAEASNITSFFKLFGDSLGVLSRLKMVTSPDSAVWQKDAFTNQWRDSGLIGGVVLTDKNGIAKLISNVAGTHDVGGSLADRDYFLWAKEQQSEGEYFAGQPIVSRLGSTKGQMIVPVASPVFYGGAFAGTLVASVRLEPLTKRYLELMKVSNVTDVFLISKTGGILYSSASNSQDKSIFEIVPEVKWAVEAETESTWKTDRRLLAYSPIDLGSQKWGVVISSPVSSVENLAMPIYIRIGAMLVMVILTIFLFGVEVTRENQKRLK